MLAGLAKEDETAWMYRDMEISTAKAQPTQSAGRPAAAADAG